MQVVVIDSAGKRLAEGEWDGDRIDGEYARVNGQLYHCAYVYHAEYANMVMAMLVDAEYQVKQARNKQMDALMEVGNKYRARK